MKKYTTPSVRIVVLSEEYNLMFTASNKETTNDSYFSNSRGDEDANSSIWED